MTRLKKVAFRMLCVVIIVGISQFGVRAEDASRVT